MKKMVISIFALAFLLSAVNVLAKEGNGKVDLSKPIKVDNVKIEKKQVLSDGERSLGDNAIKGKSGGSSKPSRTTSYATGILGEPLPFGAQKHAIVIGLSNYAGTANDLCVTHTSNDVDTLCSDGDSLNMKDALKNKYGYTDINVFRDSEATFTAIQQKVESILATAGTNDEIVFFFSGHSAAAKQDIFSDGITSHLGLALYGMSNNSMEIIWDEQLKNMFAGATTNRIVFIFDTCHAGQLESYLQGTGREVVMSSLSNQYSYTYTLGGKNGLPGEGLFTHYFAKEGILNNQADAYNALKNPDTNVTVEEAYAYARQIVPTVKNLQVPFLNDKFTNDLLLGYFNVN